MGDAVVNPRTLNGPSQIETGRQFAWANPKYSLKTAERQPAERRRKQAGQISTDLAEIILPIGRLTRLDAQVAAARNQRL